MPRKPRIHIPGAVNHVILRGNAGQQVFFYDRDRYRLYLFLQYVVDKFGCRMLGFCLMTNHIHLVMQGVNVLYKSNAHCQLYRQKIYCLWDFAKLNQDEKGNR
jgi:REP element-mobilizing transposase RayT